MSQMAAAQARKPVQSTPAQSSGVLQRKYDKCRKKKPILQRSAISSAPETVPPIVHEVLRSPGQPLDPSTRAFMEPRFGHDFSRIPTHSPVIGAIQTKLAINKPGDEYEQEADRVADQVLAAPAHSPVSGAPPRIQRYTGQTSGQTGTAPASVDRVLASPGRPLEPALRQDMEHRFGHDFSRVRVHSGAASEQSARDVNANAYTVGHDIVFSAGRFAPRTHEGRRLIAHELTHVVQQSGADGIRVGQINEKRGLHTISTSLVQRYGVDVHYPSSEEGRAMTGEPGSDNPESTAMVPGQAEDAAPNSGELIGSPSACVLQSAMPYSRSGIIRSWIGSVTEDFEVLVEWSSAKHRGQASYCAAECGEYHQFVKGYAKSSPKKDGSGLIDDSGKIFGGKPLKQDVFQEDGRDNNPAARYGHRNEKQTMNEKYEPDRATGTKYLGKDSPGVFIGTFADFDLTFVGKLVDTCNGTETVSDPWRVFYRGVIRP